MQTSKDWKEYLPIMFEFIISLVSILGFLGAAIYAPENKTIEVLAPVVITAVITFWFQRRQTESMIDKQSKNNIEQTKATTEQIQAATQPVQEVIKSQTEKSE